MSPLLVFLLAGASGSAATWAARGAARRVGFVAPPNPIVPQHTHPVAYLGGLGVMGGLVGGWVLGGFAAPEVSLLPAPLPAGPVIFGMLAFLGLGLVDDAVTLGPLTKLFGQTLAAALVAALGLAVPLTGNALLDAALAAGWIVVVVNACNILDVCDGLLGGVVVVGLLPVAFTVPALRGFALLIAGATLGFLFFNRPPASIFLGDAGSHLLGFLLAAVTIAGMAGLSLVPGVAWAGLVAAVPLFELAFVVVARARKGLAWWRGSPDHLALRLQAAGLSRLQTDLAAWTAALLAAALAVALPDLGALGRALATAGLLGAGAISWRFLLRHEVRPSRS